jgi:hypothetical protein
VLGLGKVSDSRSFYGYLDVDVDTFENVAHPEAWRDILWLMPSPYLEKSREKCRHENTADVIPIRPVINDEAEWSEIGRDRRLQAGWYLLPPVMAWTMLAIAIYLFF